MSTTATKAEAFPTKDIALNALMTERWLQETPREVKDKIDEIIASMLQGERKEW